MIANAYVSPGEQTYRFRHHADGSLSILSADGRTVLDHISKEKMAAPVDRTWNASMDDPIREARGVMLGFLLGFGMWGVVGFVWWMTCG